MRAKSYHFGPEGFTVAARTIEQFVARAIRLYEQDRKEPRGPSRLEMYVRRWAGWATGSVTATSLHDIPVVPGTASW